jgi:hypothetical protein
LLQIGGREEGYVRVTDQLDQRVTIDGVDTGLYVLKAGLRVVTAHQVCVVTLKRANLVGREIQATAWLARSDGWIRVAQST